MKKVIVLGATGMLGSMVLDYLVRDNEIQLSATSRSEELGCKFRELARGYNWQTIDDWYLLDAECTSIEHLSAILRGKDYAINCIGIIKPYIHDDNFDEVKRAVRVNTQFPKLLAKAAENTDCQVLSIATDCIWKGSKGQYVEGDNHDATDVYGKTKSKGEVKSPNVHHLRCSIVGLEPKGHVSLLEWFLAQPKDAQLNGYTNHQWNGITTLHFAKICKGIMKNNIQLAYMQHVVPEDQVSKAGLLQLFRHEFNRKDIVIKSIEAQVAVDRTLATEYRKENRELWQAAGYSSPLTISKMIAELARYDYRLRIG